MAQDISQGDSFEWFDGDVATIEYVADDGRVFLRDSDGLHKTSLSTLRTALRHDTEQNSLFTHREPRGYAGEKLFA